MPSDMTDNYRVKIADGRGGVDAVTGKHKVVVHELAWALVLRRIGGLESNIWR